MPALTIRNTSLARGVGRGFPTPDEYIAAIAAACGFADANRDIAPFAAGRVETIDPREASL